MVISNISKMKDMGVLTDRGSHSTDLQFRKFNLIYGLNGSGKSTIGRIFSSIEQGRISPNLPKGSSFEVNFCDGVKLSNLGSFDEKKDQLVVFNGDFIEANLQWSDAKANPVFYIGKAQAKVAEKLKRLEARLQLIKSNETNQASALKSAEKEMATFKRERAKLISSRLYLENRKYEALQLAKDNETWSEKETHILSSEQLDAFTETCRANTPLPDHKELYIDPHTMEGIVVDAKSLLRKTPAQIVDEQLKKHSEML